LGGAAWIPPEPRSTRADAAGAPRGCRGRGRRVSGVDILGSRPGGGGRASGEKGPCQGRPMWPDPVETDRLLSLVERADPAAAEELWERHRPALHRMVGLRLDPALGRRVDASDVVQEVLLKASQRLEDYLRRPVLPFHLWLRQIARDQVIDAH